MSRPRMSLLLIPTQILQSLTKLKHDHIIRCLEVIRERTELNLVFEFMDSNLYTRMQSAPDGLTDAQIRHYT